jgi:hypothetical protein
MGGEGTSSRFKVVEEVKEFHPLRVRGKSAEEVWIM